MKILYSRTQAAAGRVSGGAVAHTLGVIDGFSRLGELAIITNEPLYGVDQLKHKIPVEIIRPFGSGGVSELLYNLYYPSRLSARIIDFQPDFVYHRFGGFSYATARVCQQLNVPLVLEFNSSPLRNLQAWTRSPLDMLLAMSKLPFLRRIENYNLQAAFLIVVPAQPSKDNLLERGFSELSEQRILVNPNAVNPEKFRPMPNHLGSEIKHKLGIPLDQTIVGFAGSFGPWHGMRELAEAITRVNSDSARRQQLFFVFYGDGNLRSVIEDLIGHYENVIFAGKIEYACIQDYLSICDILVAPLIKDAAGYKENAFTCMIEYAYTKNYRAILNTLFAPRGKPLDAPKSISWPGSSPTKVFEYMALGKGIVASNLDYIGQIVRDGETGVSIPPGDVDALVQGICYLADHPEEASRMGREARRVVCERHTWEHHTRRIIDAFTTLKAATN